MYVFVDILITVHMEEGLMDGVDIMLMPYGDGFISVIFFLRSNLSITSHLLHVPDHPRLILQNHYNKADT